MTAIPWRLVLVAAVLISAANTLTGAVLGTLVSWPGTWTPGDRASVCAIALDIGAGLLLERTLTRGKAKP